MQITLLFFFLNDILQLLFNVKILIGIWRLLRVKLSFFRNKGFAVAVGVSHQICDTV